MTDFTPPQLTINPLWVTLGISLLRMTLLAGGSVTAADAQNQATQIVGFVVAIVTAGWGLWSWWQVHNKAKALNAAPPGAAVEK